MKKLALSLMATVILCYSNFTFSSGTDIIKSEPLWTGFYLGGNAGYWWSQTNNITTTGSTSFINPEFELGASNIANALAQMANNGGYSFNSDGFIGGAQGGYNYELNKGILLGINIDLDALSNSNSTYNLQKTVNLVDFDENYAGSLAIKQRVNYLSAVRARLGYLFYPTLLIYATGGFAYGNVTLDTSWTAQESLGSIIFPTVAAQNNRSKTVPGWTAGGGIEWLFRSNWSALLEYSYYSLNDLNAPVTLTQINGSTSPPTLWGSAAANTNLSLSLGTVRFGINYHFA